MDMFTFDAAPQQRTGPGIFHINRQRAFNPRIRVPAPAAPAAPAVLTPETAAPTPDPAAPPAGTRQPAYRTNAVRQTLLSLCALGLVITVIPLMVLQIPDAVAWVVPPRVAAAGPGPVASLLRASGLALPAMAVAGSLAALMVRWLRAGPVLLSGLLVLAAADALGGLVRTVALIGVDRSMHGAGAGIAAAGVVAVVTERRTQTQAPNGGPRVLAASWAAVMVAGLAAAPELMRHRVGSGDWVVALQPVPWLTGAALALGALYALLAEGTATVTARNLFPAAERTQLALLTSPAPPGPWPAWSSCWPAWWRVTWPRGPSSCTRSRGPSRRPPRWPRWPPRPGTGRWSRPRSPARWPWRWPARRAGPEAARRSWGPAASRIMGKLTLVANRIVDRGELYLCPVKERRCQNMLSS